MLTVWQYGYQQGNRDQLLERCAAAGVTDVWDVRFSPWSPNPDFCLHRMKVACTNARLGYYSVPDLGNPYPRDEDAMPWVDTVEALRVLYGKAGTKEARALATLARAITDGRRVCVLCACKSQIQCHRFVVCEMLARLFADGLAVEPLWVPAVKQRELFGGCGA